MGEMADFINDESIDPDLGECAVRYCPTCGRIYECSKCKAQPDEQGYTWHNWGCPNSKPGEDGEEMARRIMRDMGVASSKGRTP